MVRRQFDKYGGEALWLPVTALILLGLLFVYSASSIFASQKFGDELLFIRKQTMHLGIGIIAAFVAAMTPLKWIDRFLTPLLLITLLATIATQFPGIGKTVNGAARWLNLGGFVVQPAEFLKVTTILFISHRLWRHPQNIVQLWIALPCMAAILIQPDFGTTVILCAGIAAMAVVHGIPKRILAIVGSIGLPIAIFVMILEPYRVKRLLSFMDPFSDPRDGGFQLLQSYVAIVNGGIFGKGLGESQQKLFFLPEAHTDFILAVICEESGFLGFCIVILLYGLVFYTILNIARKAATHRERLLAVGIFAMFASSTLVNIGVVGGLLPTKGLPLPFISAGGSTLVTNLFMMGLIGRIHKNAMELGPLEGSKLMGEQHA